jgi:hypothetical protein
MAGDESMRARIGVALIALAGSALLGVVGGLVWAVVAPRALLQEVGQGTAEVVNSETSAFVAADGWFCVIAAVCGLIAGVVGCWFAMRRGGPLTALALVVGGVAGAFVMLGIGDQIGLSTYNHQLATAANGTFFNSSLALGAKSALAFWPMITGAVIVLRELGARGDTPQPPMPLSDVQDADR